MWIFHTSRELKWEIKAHLVYIPACRPTQHLSFDATDQFYERWSGEELVKFKQFSDVYSNWLDLLTGSIALRQSQQDSFVFTPPQHLCWKTGCCSCLLGTQDVIQAAQYLAVRNWQPLNCHFTKGVNPQKMCQAKQAAVTNKQTLFGACRMGTTDKFFIKKLSDHTDVSTHSHTVHACTRTHTHTL